jgi:hypothetical protein
MRKAGQGFGSIASKTGRVLKKQLELTAACLKLKELLRLENLRASAECGFQEGQSTQSSTRVD